MGVPTDSVVRIEIANGSIILAQGPSNVNAGIKQARSCPSLKLRLSPNNLCQSPQLYHKTIRIHSIPPRRFASICRKNESASGLLQSRRGVLLLRCVSTLRRILPQMLQRRIEILWRYRGESRALFLVGVSDNELLRVQS